MGGMHGPADEKQKQLAALASKVLGEHVPVVIIYKEHGQNPRLASNLKAHEAAHLMEVTAFALRKQSPDLGHLSLDEIPLTRKSDDEVS